jgi:DamX protein
MRSDGEETMPASVPSSSQTAEETPSSTAPETVKTLPLPPMSSTTVEGSAPTQPAASPVPPMEQSKQPLETPPVTPPKVQTAEVKPAAVPPSPPATKNEGSQSVKKVVGGLEWLKAQPDSNFTLQLMAVKDENSARRFIETHHLQDKAVYFPIMSNGQTLYAVVYGSFPKRSEAARAAKSLPSAWGTPNPWIRSFKSLPALNP